jgi:hypothetical protein
LPKSQADTQNSLLRKQLTNNDLGKQLKINEEKMNKIKSAA